MKLTKQDIIDLVKHDDISRLLNVWTLYLLSFVNKLSLKYGEIDGKIIKVGNEHIVCAGLGQLLKQYNNCMLCSGEHIWINSDAITVYFYGTTSENVNEIIKQFDTTFKGSKWQYDICNKNLIMFPYSGIFKININLNIYSTKSILISHISLNISSKTVLWDGNEYWFTIMSAVSNILHTNIIGTNMPDTKYIDQCQNYYYRIVVPELANYAGTKPIVLKTIGVGNLLNSPSYLCICSIAHIKFVPPAPQYIFPPSHRRFDSILNYLKLKHNIIYASTYNELITSPYYIDAKGIKLQLFTTPTINSEYALMLQTLLDPVLYKQYIPYIFDHMTGMLSLEDSKAMDAIESSTIEFIMKYQIEYISSQNGIVKMTIVDSGPPAMKSSVEWYGDYYKDVGMRTLPSEFNIIDTSGLSDNIRQTLLKQQITTSFPVITNILKTAECIAS